MNKEILNTEKKNKYGLIIVLIVIAIQIFTLNYLHPLYLDDWAYVLFVDDYATLYESHRIESIWEIFVSQYNHYMTWGGRTVAHVIAQTLLYMPQIVHDILNTIVYLLFIFLIYKICNYKLKANVGVLIFVAILMWFVQPALPATAIWITGSANYLWCTLLILCFLYQYYKLYRTRGEKKNDTVIHAVLLFFLGILTGWTNENMAISLLLLIAVFIYLIRKEVANPPRWIYWGMIGFILGAIILFAAPGNYLRVAGETDNAGLIGALLQPEIFMERITTIFTYYYRFMLKFVVFYIVLFFFAKKRLRNQKDKDVHLISLLFFIASHIAFVVMIGVPFFPYRAMFGIMTLMALAIGLLYANCNLSTSLFKWGNIAFLIVLVVGHIYSYRQIYSYADYMHDFWKRREAFIEECKSQGVYDVDFKEELVGHKKFETYEIDDDPELYMNKIYATFYGLKSARIDRDE